MTGLPRSIIKKYGVTKKAWSVFRGRHKRSSRKARHNPKTRTRRLGNLARRYRRRGHRRGDMTLPIAPIMGLVPMLLPAINSATSGGSPQAIGQHLLWNTIGVSSDGRFDMGKAISNFTPLIAGLLIHKFVGGAPLNFNRTLAAARVPFIRI